MAGYGAVGSSPHFPLPRLLICSGCARLEQVGVIIFGAVRDTAVLGAMPIGIKALGAHPCKSHKDDQGGRADVVLTFGGVIWRPGAWVAADQDGIIVLPTRPSE